MDSFLFKIIVFISIVFWLLPPLKQYKNRFFLFFVVLALTDPLGIVLGKIFLFIPYLLYNLSGIVAYFVLFDLKKFNKRNVLIFVILIALAGLSSNSPSKYTFYFIIFINFLILVKFLKIALIFVVENSLVNIFHMVLILYQTTSILKMLSVVENFSSGIYYFAITNIFQILIAIFFTIFREDDKRLHLDLKKKLRINLSK